MNKNKQEKTTIALVVLGAAQVLSIIWIIFLQVSLNVTNYGVEKNTNQLINTTSELRFCIKNDISPCDDLAIDEWNSKHPNDTFQRISN